MDLRRRIAFLAVISMTTVFLFAAPATANHTRSHEIDQEKASLRQKIKEAERQAKTITGQIAESDRRRAQLEAKIGGLNVALADAAVRLDQAEADLVVARTDLLTVEGNLASSLRRLDDMQGQLDAKVRDAYKAGPAAYLQMLLSSSSARDFVTRLTFVRKVVNDHQARVDRVQKLSDQFAAARLEAENRKTDIETRKIAVEAERANIAKIKTEVAVAKQQVVAELAKRKALLSKVEAEKAEYIRQMQRLEQESKNIAAILKSRQAGQVYSGARNLAWPTTGFVSSGYGYRTHPIYGDTRFHAGIDIAAPAGRPVVAADSGEVVFAGYKGGYGLVVVIDHGGAFGTVYAHLSKASVITGSRVSRGASIANVGCTGYCTGPHLHFETRIKGEPVDPMQYY